MSKRIYQTKTLPFTGGKQVKILPKARTLLREFTKKTKRQPYVRSAYFNKEKIFISYFWPHLRQKVLVEQIRRAKLLPCALELVEKSRLAPDRVQDPTNKNQAFHRFFGKTPAGKLFCVQVKESKKTGKKDFMSVFLIKKPPTS